MKFLAIAVPVVGLACFAVEAGAADESTLIRNARIFDGSSVIEATDLLIENGLISSVGRALEAPEDAIVVDADGAFLMPGLIDSHTHTFDSSMLTQSLAFGVTTDLDMFTVPSALKAMRATAGPTQADIFSSGVLVTAPGGHGTQFGIPIPTITDPSEAALFVNDRIAEGSDYIKIVLEDGSELGMNIPTISHETLGAVVRAAHERDKLAVVHIHAYEAAIAATERDADGLVHTFIDTYPDRRLEKLMVEHGTFMVPTLAVIESVCGRKGGAGLIEDEALTPYLDAAARAGLRNIFPDSPDGPKRDYEVARRSVAALHKAGIPILAGDDAPNPGTVHGVSLHRELELLVEAGLEPTDALRSATSVPATAFRLKDRGRIAPGLIADLLLVDGDPTKSITDTRHIVGVWKAGERFDREAWRGQLVMESDEAPEAVRRDLVSDFEAGENKTEFGRAWTISTDTLMGGTSTAELSVVDKGANGSAGALRVEGKIAGDVAYPWAGISFSPGGREFEPVSLKANEGFSFVARGDGRTFNVMVFASSLGRMPAIQTFKTADDWEVHSFDWSDFRGVDGEGIMAIILSAGTGTESFWFEIDDIRLK